MLIREESGPPSAQVCVALCTAITDMNTWSEELVKKTVKRQKSHHQMRMRCTLVLLYELTKLRMKQCKRLKGFGPAPSGLKKQFTLLIHTATEKNILIV